METSTTYVGPTVIQFLVMMKQQLLPFARSRDAEQAPTRNAITGFLTEFRRHVVVPQADVAMYYYFL
jgi:hypothetical protein